MDPNLVFVKTPTGDEAVRQSTRVVQRNLRMVLLQVDGSMSVADLVEKIGNPRLVEKALKELAEGGFITPSEGNDGQQERGEGSVRREVQQKAVSVMSEFSSFGPRGSSGFGNPRSSGFSGKSSFTALPREAEVAGSKPSAVDSVPSLPDVQQLAAEPSFKAKISPARIAACLVFAAMVAVLGLVFFPSDRYKSGLEEALSEALGLAVSVEKVSVALLPRPQIRLAGVRLGGGMAGTVDEVRIGSPWRLLGRSPLRVSRIDVLGADVYASAAVSMPAWRNQHGAGNKAGVEFVHVERLRVRLDDSLALPMLSGDLRFGSNGLVETANFETEDRALLVQATAGSDGINLVIEGRAWHFEGSDILFASLQARGLLQPGRLLVKNIDTTFMGGILRGSWQLDWSSVPSMTGEGTLSRIDLRKVSAAFLPTLRMEGDLSGPVKLRSYGKEWEGLWSNAEVTFNAEVTRGVLVGVDLGEASRRGAGVEVRGGTTRFDRLRGNIKVTRGQVIGRDMRMDAGMMTASGQFSGATGGQIDASLTVSLQTSVSTVGIPIRVTGKLPDLVAVSRK